MKGFHRHLRAAADATEPRPGAVERLQERSALPARLLRQAGIEPRSGAVDRLRASHRTSRPRRPLLWVVPAMAAAVAAAVLLRPSPPIAVPLAATDPTAETLTRDVRLSFTGAGEATGTERAPRIRWEAGSLAVDVTPDRGVDLTVETDEALVQVVGTTFRVTRDPMGTTVAVERGHVRVTCTREAAVELLAGQATECAPARAAGWIGRTQAMIRAGRPAEELLAAIARGSSLASSGDPAIGELEALRIRVLMDAARYDEALIAADAYLASGATPRREEVATLAEALRARP